MPNFDDRKLQVGESPDPRTLAKSFNTKKMKELTLKKKKDGRMTVMPPRKKLMTSVLARDVKELLRSVGL